VSISIFSQGNNDNPACLKQLVSVSSLGMRVEAAPAHESLCLGLEKEVFGHSDWLQRFRHARYVPAVEYIQAIRARSPLIQKVDRISNTIDVL
jgi:hypothetical protein